MQMFANPETGTLNRLQLSEFLSRIDEISGAPKEIWVYYERMINKERLFTKYNNLIKKGFYVNKLEIERRQKDMNTAVDFSFIQRKYAEIPDSAINIRESDIKKFYSDYRERYKQDESRDMKYVAFEIIPSQKDYKDAEAWINDIKPEFEKVEDVEQYINFTSPPYDATNYKKGELQDTLDDFMFSSKLGAVFGPWFEDNSFKLAKLAKINYLPDSVRASQILIPVTRANVEQMRHLADSLKTLAEKGYDFATLVKDNSRDVATVMTGGDLGWFKEGMKGRYFSDSCFFSNVGDIKITYSEEGFHVVKITGRSKPVKKVQVGILAREVTPSAETDQYYYSKAVEFASKNNTLEKFEAAVADNDPVAIPVYGLHPLDNNIQGLQNSRAIVHWAFEEAEEGDMLKDIQEYSGKYIVAIVTKVYHKGYRSINDVAGDIKLELMKTKKAEKLTEEMNKSIANVKTIDEAAKLMQLQVNSATGTRFTSFSIQGIGAEPKLIAAVTNSSSEGIHGPIAGENGVYLFSIDNVTVNENQFANNMLSRNYIERSYAARANRQSLEVLKDLANIKDLRYKFY
jgi:peptidyl-prolyl cis-trans isomerase D